MMEKDAITRLFEYDAWANRETLSSLSPSALTAPRGVTLFAHVLAAELLWLGRLEGRPQRVPIWPEWTLDACAEELSRLPGAWQAYFDNLPAGGLDGLVSYVNTKGEVGRTGSATS